MGGLSLTGERSGVWNVYAVSPETKEVRQLTHFTTTDPVMYPAWSPRGNRIVFERSESKASLWTVKLPM